VSWKGNFKKKEREREGREKDKQRNEIVVISLVSFNFQRNLEEL
jgi:TnpA family transposase